MTELTKTQQRLALALFEVGAIMFGEFRLKLHENHPDAPLSPIYLNLRTPENPKPGPLTHEIVELAALQIFLHISEKDVLARHVCGIPNAGTPFAACLAAQMHSLGSRLITLGKTETREGRRVDRIESGEFSAGDVVLLVDDLVSEADSKFEAIAVLEKAGLVVNDVLVLVDRVQGGREQLEARGYFLYPVFTLPDLLAFYVGTQKISQAMRDSVLAYIRENR